jgi:flagellar basal-body rod protein FlgG
MRSLMIGGTGMLAQQTNVEVISNNIANMTTSGYKMQRAEFQDLLYQNIRRPGAQSSDAGTIVPTGIQLGLGVKTASVYRIHTQGTIAITGNQLDLAVNGDGYFQIEMPDGTTNYTRAGSFQLNADGQIVTADGFTLLPGLTVPANTIDITIDASGQVQAKIDGQTDPQVVGQIQLARFPNNAGLESLGGNLYRESPASGAPVVGNPALDGYGSIQQGSLEQANVNVVAEITNLITAQRAYEMNSRVIRTSDEMLSALSQLR